ncbi:restriction endonuclease subunit S [Maioricimonas sp. JC845]|uniref:restriction endonuclease subunit S n=1 Tax=Maioricimonas sp. JC845 TaxID=3232138 RepID=UPI00345A3A16
MSSHTCATVPSVSIGEICSFVNGRAFKSSEWSRTGLPIIRIQNLTDRDRPFNHYDGDYDDKHLVREGDLLFSWSGTPGTSFGTFIWDRPQGLLNQHIFKVAVDTCRVHKRYFRYALNHRLGDIIRQAHGGVGLKHITKRKLEAIKIPLPPLSEQKRIAAILDKADAIRRKRAAAVEAIDSLVHATFMTTVGPDADEYAVWPLEPLASLAAPTQNAMRTGPFGSNLKHSEFVNDGIAVLGIDNAVRNRFVWDQRRFITEEKYAELKTYTVRPGDVLITIMGTIGRSAVVPEDIPTAINTKHLACITLDRDRAEPEFISNAIHRHPHILRQLGSSGRGAIMTGLNLGVIKSLQIPLPPIEQQRRLVEQLSAIRKTESTLHSSTKEAEALFNSLVQRAFRGEL